MNFMLYCAWWSGARVGWQKLVQRLPWWALFFWKTFSLGCYYQPRLKGWGHMLACPLVPVGNTNRD
jgi:hypothetical protein